MHFLLGSAAAALVSSLLIVITRHGPDPVPWKRLAIIVLVFVAVVGAAMAYAARF